MFLLQYTCQAKKCYDCWFRNEGRGAEEGKTSTCAACGAWGELTKWQMTPPQHAEVTVQMLEAAMLSQKSRPALPSQPGGLNTGAAQPEVRKEAW